MGNLMINGVNILEYVTPVNISEVGTSNSAFVDRIKGLTSSLDNKTKKIITGWSLPNNDYSTNTNYDAAQGKIKVDGVVAPVMIDGTRPRNIVSKYEHTGQGFTKYLNNVNGELYVSDSAGIASGVSILTSKASNKDVVFNLACWGSGGKGGGGSYWFLAGNWGGVGGASGAKAFMTVVIKNNGFIKIVADSDSSRQGRVTNSNDTTYESPSIYIYNENESSPLLICTGGRSGTSNNPRWSTDDLQGGGSIIYNRQDVAPIILRKTANGANKIYNGNLGRDLSFNVDRVSPYLGNSENNQGELVLTGYGGNIYSGTTPGDNQRQGSGGAGGYGNGGKASQNGGNNNSAGFPGDKGGGGGAADCPAGGADGGNGGAPGFIIFY